MDSSDTPADPIAAEAREIADVACSLEFASFHCAACGHNGEYCECEEPVNERAAKHLAAVLTTFGERQKEAGRAEMKERAAKAEEEVERLRVLINTPEIHDWLKGVEIEAPHQQERWGSEHDEGKTALDWFWLIGYLAQKAAYSAIAGDIEKAKHHTISTGAALLNWHRALTGSATQMRPGIRALEPGEGTT